MRYTFQHKSPTRRYDVLIDVSYEDFDAALEALSVASRELKKERTNTVAKRRGGRQAPGPETRGEGQK